LLLDGVRCAVAVHAHPDDESIVTGGLLARCAAEGIRTVVITCTGGDIGPRRAAVDGPLVDARAAELRAALEILGVTRHVQLGYRDSGLLGWPDNNHPDSLVQAPLSAASGKVLDVLREEQPELVVTYGADGGYGHPDHIKTHQVTVEACRISGQPGLYAVVFPRAWLAHFVEVAAAAGVEARGPALLGVDDMDPPASFGTPDGEPFEALDTSDYVDIKRAAIAAHRSQMGDDHVLVRLPARVYAEAWSREWYLPLMGE
jgi:LmbE family N-acetylglucosaminyl deacetylase